MANLDNLIRWQEFKPDLGENRRLKKPFHVLLAVGLSKLDLQRLMDSLEALKQKPPEEGEAQTSAPELSEEQAANAAAEKLAAALAPFVKLGSEPLTVNGEAIDTLAKLLKLYAQLPAGGAATLELAWALRYFNGIGGQSELFFERLSGGVAGTGQDQRAAR
jgi:hypothetical protein